MGRIGPVLAVFGAVFAGAMGAFGFETQPASACSRTSITAEYIPGAVEKSQIVAIGTFIESSEREAILRVDEALMGTGEGKLLRIDNRTSYTGMACSPYDEQFHEGNRFNSGDRRIVILEKEVDGLWQVGFYSDTAWEVPKDDLEPMITDFWNDGSRPPSLAQVRDELGGMRHLLGADLEYEARPPCNAVPGLGPRLRSSVAVAILDLKPGADYVIGEVREVLAGDVPKSTIKLNHRARRDYENCDVVLNEPGQYAPGGSYLVFLRPDEFGVGDYRIAYWGFALQKVNESYVTQGLPTLRDIREAVAASGRGVAPQINSGPGFIPESTDDEGPRLWLIAAIALVGFALAASAMTLGLRRKL